MSKHKTAKIEESHPLQPLSRKDILTATLLSTFAFLVYAFTAAPGITMEDSGDFMNGVITLGIVHPPGYPLYTMLGHLFSLIPVGDPAYTVNLFSSLWGALCLGIMFLVFRTLSIGSLYALFTSLLLGFTAVFWSKTAVAEVYTFNAFLLASIVFWILSYNRDKKKWQLYLAAFTTGLALSNHYPLTILSGVGLLFLLDRRGLHAQDFLKAPLFLVLGLTPYLYLFIQAHNPGIEYNMGRLSDFRMVIDHILRRQYPSEFGTTAWHKLVLAFWFLKAVISNFLFSSLFLFSGITFCFLQKWKYRYPFLVSALCTSLGLILILSVRRDEIFRSWLLDFTVPAFLFLSIFMALGLKTLLSKYVKNNTVQIGLLVILLLSQVAYNFRLASHHNDTLGEIWATELLNSLKPNSILILCDATPFLPYSVQLIRGLREDVSIHDRFSWWTKENLYEPIVLFKMEHAQWGYYRSKRESELIRTSQRPVYYTCNDTLRVEKIDVTATPYVYRADKQKAEASDTSQFPISDRLLEALVYGYPKSEYWVDRMRKVIFSRLISYYGGHNRPEVKKILHTVEKTKFYSDPRFMLSLANNLYFFQNVELAKTMYERAEKLSIENFNSTALAVYCSLLANAKDYDRALGICIRQEQVSSPCDVKTVKTRQTIAAIYREKKEWPKVAEYARKIIECEPNHEVAQSYLKLATQSSK